MKYVSIYGNAMSKVMPHPDMYAKDVTFRFLVYVPFIGEKYQIKLDNFCGSEEVKIDHISVSKTDHLSSTCDEHFIDLTVNGKKEFTLPPFGSIVSDEFVYDVKENEFLVISMYLKDFTHLMSGVDISGPLSKGYFGFGDMSKESVMDVNLSKSTTWKYFLSDVYAYTSDENYAVICYGDSITSQDWPDYLQLELKKRNCNHISIIRKAVSGTRILKEYHCITYQSYGLKGENRFPHEISSVMGAKDLIIQQGINDIFHPVGEEINIFRPMSDLPTVDELIEGINYYKKEAEKYHLNVYIGTLLPIYNWRTYAPFREELKNNFNRWIKKENQCIDFNEKIGVWKKRKYYQFLDGYDSGDHLHPSSYAYKAMGELAAEVILNGIRKSF